LSNTDYETKVVVLKKNIDDADAREIVEKKKTNVFRALLKRPKPVTVHLHSLKLNYEAVLMISGSYTADYYQKALHPIKVDYNVKEVVLGEGVFPIRTKSKFQKALSRKTGKNKVDLELEEHVNVTEENTLYFDHHGHEIKFPFRIDSKSVENYPTRILNINEENVKEPEITKNVAIKRLSEKLKKPIKTDVRDLNDELIINEISKIYVPIYEARLIGPKKNVGILRIDAVRKKIL
jgi:hypothetical protein